MHRSCRAKRPKEEDESRWQRGACAKVDWRTELCPIVRTFRECGAWIGGGRFAIVGKMPGRDPAREPCHASIVDSAAFHAPGDGAHRQAARLRRYRSQEDGAAR